MRIKHSRLANKMLYSGSYRDKLKRNQQTFAAIDHESYLDLDISAPTINFEGKNYKLKPINMKQ